MTGKPTSYSRFRVYSPIRTLYTAITPCDDNIEWQGLMCQMLLEFMWGSAILVLNHRRDCRCAMCKQDKKPWNALTVDNESIALVAYSCLNVFFCTIDSGHLGTMLTLQLSHLQQCTGYNAVIMFLENSSPMNDMMNMPVILRLPIPA